MISTQGMCKILLCIVNSQTLIYVHPKTAVLLDLYHIAYIRENIEIWAEMSHPGTGENRLEYM